MRNVPLRHITAFNEILRADFGSSLAYFSKQMCFSGQVAKNIKTHGRLFKTFKLKQQRIHTRSNFFSDKSLQKVCQLSHYSLEELVIRSGLHLSNQGIINGIQLLKRLRLLDIGYTQGISDSFITQLCESDTA